MRQTDYVFLVKLDAMNALQKMFVQLVYLDLLFRLLVSVLLSVLMAHIKTQLQQQHLVLVVTLCVLPVLDLPLKNVLLVWQGKFYKEQVVSISVQLAIIPIQEFALNVPPIVSPAPPPQTSAKHVLLLWL
jgi:hypothetical protein